MNFSWLNSIRSWRGCGKGNNICCAIHSCLQMEPRNSHLEWYCATKWLLSELMNQLIFYIFNRTGSGVFKLGPNVNVLRLTVFKSSWKTHSQNRTRPLVYKAIVDYWIDETTNLKLRKVSVVGKSVCRASAL